MTLSTQQLQAAENGPVTVDLNGQEYIILSKSIYEQVKRPLDYDDSEMDLRDAYPTVMKAWDGSPEDNTLYAVIKLLKARTQQTLVAALTIVALLSIVIACSVYQRQDYPLASHCLNTPNGTLTVTVTSNKVIDAFSRVPITIEINKVGVFGITLVTSVEYWADIELDNGAFEIVPVKNGYILLGDDGYAGGWSVHIMNDNSIKLINY